jgi:hypothetical protein
VYNGCLVAATRAEAGTQQFPSLARTVSSITFACDMKAQAMIKKVH